jgi:hypothetical protein
MLLRCLCCEIVRAEENENEKSHERKRKKTWCGLTRTEEEEEQGGKTKGVGVRGCKLAWGGVGRAERRLFLNNKRFFPLRETSSRIISFLLAALTAPQHYPLSQLVRLQMTVGFTYVAS